MGNGADDRLNGNHHAYESEACQQCGNYTLVRSGTQVKCDSCSFEQTPGVSLANEPLDTAQPDEPPKFPILRIEDTFGAH